MAFQNDFTHPITKNGTSQIVFPPPWHYGVTFISAHVKFESVEDILPNFLKSDGEGWIYIADFVSTSEHNWDYMYQDPDLVQYMEAAIGIKVFFENKNYLYFPFMWVDKDWALVRGWLDGYPKKLAKISMTRLHPLLPKYSSIGPEIILGGYAVRGAGLLLKLQIKLKEKVDSIPLRDFGPVLTIRRFPARGENETDLYELVSRIRDVNVNGEIWKGEANVELRGNINDDMGSLKVDKIYGGYYYTQYFRVTRTQLIKKIVAEESKIFQSS